MLVKGPHVMNINNHVHYTRQEQYQYLQVNLIFKANLAHHFIGQTIFCVKTNSYVIGPRNYNCFHFSFDTIQLFVTL